MQIAELNGLAVHYRDDGDPKGAPVVFANSLGTDLRLWDQVIALLPKGLRYITYDKRGRLRPIPWERWCATPKCCWIIWRYAMPCSSVFRSAG